MFTKTKTAKAQLQETREELSAETAVRRKLEQENSRLRLEINFWVKELEKMEELRQAEARTAELLRREETDRVKWEMGHEVEMLKMEVQEDLTRLEQAVASEHEQWRQEREKLQGDLENVGKRCDDGIAASWRERAESWAQKMWEMIDLLKEAEKSKGTGEELRKEPEKMRSSDKNFLTRCFRSTEVREGEQLQEEMERLELLLEESRARTAEMGEVMEALVEEMEEMEEMMRRYQAEEERPVSENQRNVKEERKQRCNILECSWRERSNDSEEKIQEKDKLLEKRTEEMEVQQLENDRA